MSLAFPRITILAWGKKSFFFKAATLAHTVPEVPDSSRFLVVRSLGAA